jgi:ABC-type glycerol-3-phosphate transport system permease component
MTRRLLRILGQLPLLAWTALTLGPFLLITALSLRSTLDIFAHPLGVGGAYTTRNLIDAWRGPFGSAGMRTFFTNTLITAATALLINLTTATTAAYSATKLTHRQRQWYLRIFMLGSVAPLVLLIIPLYRIYSELHLTDSPVALGVAYAALALPTSVLILTAYFLDFPTELTEAASIDGLGEFAAYLRIVLPLSKGAMTAVGMLTLVWVWSETQLGIVLLQTTTAQTAAVGLLGFQGQFVTNLGAIFAGLTVAALPIFAVYLALHRHISKGIALGGVFR